MKNNNFHSIKKCSFDYKTCKHELKNVLSSIPVIDLINLRCTFTNEFKNATHSIKRRFYDTYIEVIGSGWLVVKYEDYFNFELYP